MRFRLGRPDARGLPGMVGERMKCFLLKPLVLCSRVLIPSSILLGGSST